MSDTKTSVLFIHGLWLHASSWQPWVDLFDEAGYDAIAPGWPGIPDTVEAAREHDSLIGGVGIDDVVDRYSQVIDNLTSRPIIIGHSFGGMIAEKLLGMDLAQA